jgi:hypothetical protein
MLLSSAKKIQNNAEICAKLDVIESRLTDMTQIIVRTPEIEAAKFLGYAISNSFTVDERVHFINKAKEKYITAISALESTGSLSYNDVFILSMLYVRLGMCWFLTNHHHQARSELDHSLNILNSLATQLQFEDSQFAGKIIAGLFSSNLIVKMTLPFILKPPSSSEVLERRTLLERVVQLCPEITAIKEQIK